MSLDITLTAVRTTSVYDANITHNLGEMAEAVGIYKHLWRPEEIGIAKAEQLIEPLSKGYNELEANPDKYKSLNPDNGWGNYDGLLKFVRDYLHACIENPDAEIEVSR